MHLWDKMHYWVEVNSLIVDQKEKEKESESEKVDSVCTYLSH